MLGRYLGQLHVYLIYTHDPQVHLHPLHQNLRPAFRASESQDDGGRHHVAKPGTASVVRIWGLESQISSNCSEIVYIA